MTVTLTIPTEMEDLIREKIDSGEYSSPIELVQEGLRLLGERDKLRRLREMIAVGDAQIARGEAIEWTQDSMERLIREADEEDRLGLPISGDVQP
jgi:antitoxin ParD1/3/4